MEENEPAMRDSFTQKGNAAGWRVVVGKRKGGANDVQRRAPEFQNAPSESPIVSWPLWRLAVLSSTHLPCVPPCVRRIFESLRSELAARVALSVLVYFI
jgi:hypothetical protein